LEDVVLHISNEFNIYLDEDTPIFRIQYFKEKADASAEKRRQQQQQASLARSSRR